MNIRKTTWVESENNPASLTLAMIEAKVPGDARIIEMKTKEAYSHQLYYRQYGQASAVEYHMISFLFEWFRDEDREDAVMVTPSYRRKFFV